MFSMLFYVRLKENFNQVTQIMVIYYETRHQFPDMTVPLSLQ